MSRVRPPRRLLLVTAHPDDETIAAGLVYRVARERGGSVDLLVVTDGESGFRYAHLAEAAYGVRLTDPRVARRHLARIRRRELRAAAALLGIRAVHFLGEPDRGDRGPDQLGWDVARVRARLRRLLRRARHEAVIVMAPLAETHSHHQAAAVLSLEVVAELPPPRPLVLGASLHTTRADLPALCRRGFPILGPAAPRFRELAGHPLTRVLPSAPAFELDLRRRFGPGGRLDYRLVHGAVISRHLTQGGMQVRSGFAELERYAYFAINGPDHLARAAALFRRAAPS